MPMKSMVCSGGGDYNVLTSKNCLQEYDLAWSVVNQVWSGVWGCLKYQICRWRIQINQILKLQTSKTTLFLGKTPVLKNSSQMWSLLFWRIQATKTTSVCSKMVFDEVKEAVLKKFKLKKPLAMLVFDAGGSLFDVETKFWRWNFMFWGNSVFCCCRGCRGWGNSVVCRWRSWRRRWSASPRLFWS